MTQNLYGLAHFPVLSAAVILGGLDERSDAAGHRDSRHSRGRWDWSGAGANIQILADGGVHLFYDA